jgi:hypothetical protein
MAFVKKDRKGPSVVLSRNNDPGDNSPGSVPDKGAKSGGSASEASAGSRNAARQSRRRMSSSVEVDEVPNPQSSVRRPSRRGAPTGEVGEGGEGKGKMDPKVLLGVGVGVVLLVIFLATRGGGGGGGGGGDVVAVTPPVDEKSTEVTTSLSNEERVRQEVLAEGYGISNSSGSSVRNQIPIESDVFVKDLSGADVKEIFVDRTVTLIRDFVSYVKHRAVTDEGIELYWLEGDYKGKKCKMDIKYNHFKTLADTGVVMCDIEVVETTEGNKIITWFGPIADPLSSMK